MDLSEILKQKKEKNSLLKKRFSLPTKLKSLWLVKISDKILIKGLRDGLIVLPAGFILEIEWIKDEKLWENVVATWKIKSDELIGFDFIVCDDTIENLNKYFKLWIVPIVGANNTLKSVLSEFNPMKNEWNAYIFQENEKWNIFYAITRYLENSKFPFDNKNLTKNIIEL
jgi:hypothetical protein